MFFVFLKAFYQASNCLNYHCIKWHKDFEIAAVPQRIEMRRSNQQNRPMNIWEICTLYTGYSWHFILTQHLEFKSLEPFLLTIWFYEQQEEPRYKVPSFYSACLDFILGRLVTYFTVWHGWWWWLWWWWWWYQVHCFSQNNTTCLPKNWQDPGYGLKTPEAITMLKISCSRPGQHLDGRPPWNPLHAILNSAREERWDANAIITKNVHDLFLTSIYEWCHLWERHSRILSRSFHMSREAKG